MQSKRSGLEQYARELEAMRADDLKVLDELCTVYWGLERYEESLATYQRLLRYEGPAQDSAFDAIYLGALRATGSCPTPARRRHRLIHLVQTLQDTAQVIGDVVECGCFLGLSSYMLCRYLQRQRPQFDGTGYHIFDSFQGLSEPTADDEIPHDWDGAERLRQMSQRGAFAATLERVSANLREFPAIRYHRGWIPLTFAGLPEAHYRFVHVDVDLYDPTLDTLAYFYPRLSPGGAIVSDDYSWPGARTAIDEFCAEHELEFQVTAFNQAVIRKPRTVD